MGTTMKRLLLAMMFAVCLTSTPRASSILTPACSSSMFNWDCKVDIVAATTATMAALSDAYRQLVVRIIPPNIISFTPTSGAEATSVTVTGTGFLSTQGNSVIKFNGVTATPTSWSATSITVPVPTGATTGPVTVTVGGRTSSLGTFTVSSGSTQSQYVTCTTTTANLTQSTVQTAVTAAADGAVVCLPAGTATWSGSINFSNSKGVTVAGQDAVLGSGSTTNITVTASSGTFLLDTLSGTNLHTYRMTGMRFSGSIIVSGMFWFYGFHVTASLQNVRIDHNTFTGFDSASDTSTLIFLGESSSANTVYALLDHNTWTATNNSMFVKPFGNGDPNTGHASSNRGTNHLVIMENNTFTFTTAGGSTLGGGCMDSWRAAEMLIRYNTFTNCLTTFHGVDHQTTLLVELYGNTFIRTSGSGGIWEDGTRLVHHQGSGEFFVWGNTWKHTGTISGNALSITHYRSSIPCTTTDCNPNDGNYTSALAQCDGTTTTVTPDGNTSTTATYRGWPCWYMPGRAPNGGSPAWGILSPVYSWMNVDFSTSGIVPMFVEDPFIGSPDYITTHMVANRDYYDAVSATAQTSTSSPFNGTTGGGFGTLARMPVTCTHTTAPDGDNGGGVFYWATDQGTWLNGGAGGVLYRCSSTNTFTSHYVPYPYPAQWP